jgi:hypothetical protein
MVKARHHPLKDRFRHFKFLSSEVAPTSFYRDMSDSDLAEALNVGLFRANADKSLRFTVRRPEVGEPTAELHGAGRPWLGPPQEAFFRLAEIGEDAGTDAVKAAFASSLTRARHSEWPQFERPEDDHRRWGWLDFFLPRRRAR